MFSGNVTQRIARASIFQLSIRSKIAIDTVALSWVRQVRIKFKTFSMSRPQSFISSIGVRAIFYGGGGGGGGCGPFAQKILASCPNFYKKVEKKRGSYTML